MEGGHTGQVSASFAMEKRNEGLQQRGKEVE